MSYRINTNLPSLAAQRSLSNTAVKQSETLGHLSSGKRIVSAYEDAAGLAISSGLSAKIRGIAQAERNANDGISMIQTAEGGFHEIANNLTRLRELAVGSASDTGDDQIRKFSDEEFQNLKEEIGRIAAVTEFNNRKVLSDTDHVVDIQVGIGNNPDIDRIRFTTENLNATPDSLGIEGLTVGTKDDAQGSLEVIDDAIQKVSGQRAILGAAQNRLASTVRNIQISSENLKAANSRIIDADYAAETSDLARLNILNAAGTSVLSQANINAKNVLKLLS